MNIGILTYHYVFNEGAVWQASALCTALRQALPGHRVEIIDYRRRSTYEAILAGRGPEVARRYESVFDGLLGPVAIEEDGTDELFDVIEHDYDAVIVGSDIVWQFRSRSDVRGRWRRAFRTESPPTSRGGSAYARLRDVKNWSMRVARRLVRKDPREIPFPNAYWLDPRLSCRKCAFAASIGYSDVSRLPAEPRRRMKLCLDAFDFLSVRDEPTLNFIRTVNPEAAARTVRVPDPAWLDDRPLPDGRALLDRLGVPADGRRAGLLFATSGVYGRNLQRWVGPLLKARGFSTVSLLSSNPAADHDVGRHVLSPFEWWAVIRELDFLVTERTHPTIAAIQGGTPFLNVDLTALMHGAAHSKSYELLTDFGLADGGLFRPCDFNETRVRESLARAIERPWDWAAIAARADDLRAQGREAIARMGDVLRDR